MTTDDLFYTRTMAKVFVDQGNLKKAADIYKHLLAGDPGRQDLMDALSDVERKLDASSPDRLIELFGNWIDLLLRHHKLQKLTRFRNYLKGTE